MTFCTDIDLLHWEPNICRDAAFASQTLIAGSGDLAGTVFTIASGSFSAAHVAADKILNPSSLVRACTLGTLHLIYSALAAVADKPTDLLARAQMYEQLYRRALGAARVELDLNGDGKADDVRTLGVLQLQRI